MAEGLRGAAKGAAAGVAAGVATGSAIGSAAVFPGDPLNSLEGCVSSLSACNYRMDLLLATLDTGIEDFPRIQQVLSNKRHFEVVSKSDMEAAQQALEHEIYPQVQVLLQRAEAGIAKLERCEKALQSKVDLQEVRLQQPARLKHMHSAQTDGAEQLSRIKELSALRLKKERLIYALDRLSLESEQKVGLKKEKRYLETKCNVI
ncbi:hypothetical protein PORY_000815 [Pneumocystis oryctolagi]|uniref:Uncharacterized protein n=1 Tax=Pneumocystis oryctolagi TaxID=42067 RepID=A0ACB7CFQ5_9ASCO|nr:hypothetical protein PORY_000815 [Pneumocystis oryctolagi]